MHICVVSPAYPYVGIPLYTFVEQFCVAMAKAGNQITVIAPQSLLNRVFKHQKHIPRVRIDTYDDVNIMVYSPLGFTGYRKSKTGKVFNKISAWIIHREIRRRGINPDVFYCHFWKSGLLVYEEAMRQNRPLFIASGESVIPIVNNNKRITELCNYVSGVICVSTKNKNESILNGLATPEKCIVIPNAIDSSLFRKKNKRVLRKQLGFNEKDFIVAYVGYFCERKGSRRLSSAISLMNDSEVKSIFIGSNLTDDDYSPNCPNVLFMEKLEHSVIPDYLNCADVFVLPTLHEGCCNAIIEAMACGLPVISSARDFNEDILDDTCSILVDPLDIEEIAGAIHRIKNDKEMRIRLSEAALKKAESLNLATRANKVLKYITDNVNS